MRKLVLILFLVFIIACKAKEIDTVVFFDNRQTQPAKYLMDIPKGYNLAIKESDGEGFLELQFWYSDSSVLYISNFESNLNYANLKSNDTLYSRDFFAFCNHDTLQLTEITTEGLLWKNNRFSSLTIGFSNVKIADSCEFEKALRSFRKARR